MIDSLRKKVIPFLDWLPGYQKGWLRFDVIAGLTASAVVIPKAMAYASIAGLPLEVGLYTVFIPLVIYAVLGTSRVLSVSTTSMIAILTASAIAQAVPQGNPAQLMAAASTLALLVGVMLLAASKGTEIELVIDGSDESTAMAQLSDLIDSGFGEEE